MLPTLITPIKSSLSKAILPLAFNTLCLKQQSFKRFNSSTSKKLFEATNETYESLINQPEEKNVLVDFYANWCGPCKMLGPVLEKVVEKNENDMLVKVNVDECEKVALKERIYAIPTVFFYKNGKVISEFTGARNEYAVKRFIEESLKDLAKKNAKK